MGIMGREQVIFLDTYIKSFTFYIVRKMCVFSDML